ncbi:helix-turn-helix transcriptional regulator, partial [Ruminococcus sp.]|uniref:helix-turn-helix transcriptional regulator n=1 Tax=Ruminococcus sp. TaxID=41978 RepID=UPI0030782B2F
MDIETANRLLQYRKKHNLSQEDLANKIGVSRQAVSKWERAEASPDTDNLILLAEIYGVSLDELLKGESNNSSKSEAEQETVSGESADNTQIPTGDEGT